MTEIAAIFHWSLSDLQALDADELIFWHGRATSWFNRVHGGKAS